jgi:membrane protease YdiL (CAAX protease family)
MMTSIKAFIKQHPLLTYFFLAFAISWGGMLLTIAAAGGSAFPASGEEIGRLIGSVYAVWLMGPAVAAILSIALVHGRAGLRELLARLLKWRVGAGWYAVALLTAPLLIAAILFPLALTSSEFLPRLYVAGDRTSLLQFGIVAGLLVAIFEELGWTGFVVPTLRRRYSVFKTGLILGFLWCAWRSLVIFWASGDTRGELSPILFLVAVVFTWQPASRVLLVWLYDRTGSLLVTMLMHASFVTFWTILTPLTVVGVPLVTYYLILAAALWLVVVAVFIVSRRRLPALALRRRLA